MSASVQHDQGSATTAATGRHDRWPLWSAAVAALVSGVAVFVNGLAVRHFDDATVYTTAKNLIAGLLLVIVAARARRRSLWGKSSKRWSPV